MKKTSETAQEKKEATGKNHPVAKTAKVEVEQNAETQPNRKIAVAEKVRKN